MKSLIVYPSGKYYIIPDILDIIRGKYILNLNADEFIQKIFGKSNLKNEYINYGTN